MVCRPSLKWPFKKSVVKLNGNTNIPNNIYETFQCHAYENSSEEDSIVKYTHQAMQMLLFKGSKF